MNPITFASPQLVSLARSLAPVLARVEREPGPSERKRASRRKTKADPLSDDCYGAIVVHVRRYLELPVGRRPRPHEYCLAHGISPTTFASSITKENRIRRSPEALAERELYESAARTLLAMHPRATRKQRVAFAHAHGFDLRRFGNAFRRVTIIAAYEAARAKGRAA